MAGPDEVVEVAAAPELQTKVRWLEERAKEIYMAMMRLEMRKPHAGDHRKLFTYAKELSEVGDLWTTETNTPF